MPWGDSIPLISPTTLFVTGSMMWMLSPAEFVWMIRSFDPCAATKENDAVHRTIAARTVRPPRKTCWFVIFVLPLFNDSYPPETLSGGKFVYQETSQLPAATSPFLPAQRLSMST